MVEFFVGTSGWMYDWNLGGSLDWYVRNSGLNAVELNASFYRFPFPSQVAAWARKGRRLRWAVKVHRSITHVRRLSEKALETWRRFNKLFDPLDSQIDFYLFQMPPNFAATNLNLARVRRFIREAQIGERFAIEFRHDSWFRKDLAEMIAGLEATYVSIDSPMASLIIPSNKIIYLRMHGRTSWYSHNYSEDELREIAESVKSHDPERAYIFFNNDHWMLKNARFMLGLLKRISKQVEFSP